MEKSNKSLKGALPDNYFSRMGIDVSKLAALIDSINNINTIARQDNAAENPLRPIVFSAPDDSSQEQDSNTW